MTTNDLVRSWKDPDSRTADLDFHPAGRIDLDQAGGTPKPSGHPTVTTATPTTVTFPTTTVTTVTTVTVPTTLTL